jgi:hypothetical protein
MAAIPLHLDEWHRADPMRAVIVSSDGRTLLIVRLPRSEGEEQLQRVASFPSSTAAGWALRAGTVERSRPLPRPERKPSKRGHSHRRVA